MQKISASRENAKAEHRRFTACNPRIHAGVPDIRAYCCELWDSGKQHLSRNQVGERYADQGWNLLAARPQSTTEK